jgi:nucleoside-diphosphate-sugar epimerase
MASVLVVGGTRFIGRAIVEGLLADGHAVCLLHRGRTKAESGLRVNEILGDRRGGQALALAFASPPDWIVDTCAYEDEDLASILHRKPPGLQRYILISTVSVYGDMHEFPTQEDHPYFEGDPGKSAAARYAAGKIACEARLRASGIPFTILRPAFVYGPWNTLYREAYYFDLLAKGEPVTAGETGGFLTQLGHAEDLAAAVLACARSERARGGIYNVTGPAMTQSRVIQTILDAASPGSALAEGPAPCAPYGIKRHLCVSTARLSTDTPWRPRIGLLDGMRSTFEWYKAHGEERRSLWERGAQRSNQTR